MATKLNLTRREWIHSVGACVLVPVVGLSERALSERPRRGSSVSLLKKSPDQPQPASFDRLPLAWYKQAVARLKERLKDQEVDGILLTDSLNLIYFTGFYHTRLERPFAALLPYDTEAVYWYGPAMDRDLIRSWWCTELEYYFDYPHADGGYPNQGAVHAGARVDLTRWILERVKARGFGQKALAVDFEPAGKRLRLLEDVFPGARFLDISTFCLEMRMVKTVEEIALAQRALEYLSQAHAFARDYLLQHGTNLTTRDIVHATSDFAHDLINRDIPPTGQPHIGVGIKIELGCRTGVATAYPHPNQRFSPRIRKGDALQVTGTFLIGGHGGELYSYYQLAPWDNYREKVWDVVTESVRIQVRESKAGVLCSEVARKIHDFQVKNGMQELIYHRPGHGSAIEGHQAPYIALGEHTPMQVGMMFSVEPGLYDLGRGFGYNPSDNLLITERGALLQGSLPYSKEWSFLKL